MKGDWQNLIHLLGLPAGFAAGVLAFLSLGGAGLSFDARATAGVGACMAVWWMTQALPIEVVGLVPLAAFPVLGIGKVGQVAAPYANEVVFLFLGGLLLGRALEACRLHERFGFWVLRRTGTRASMLVLGFLIATSFASCWVSNTAAAIMMMPVGLAAVAWVRQHDPEHAQRVAAPIMLAIAYGASIGGCGTLIGTPPVSQFAAFSREKLGVQITFLDWMVLGMPLVIVGCLAAWLVLTRIAFRLPKERIAGLEAAIKDGGERLGVWTPAQRRTLVVFVLAAGAWVVVPLLQRLEIAKPGGELAWLSRVSDSVIAMIAALALFVVPNGTKIDGGGAIGGGGGRLLSWQQAEQVPWGVLLLFGGGLSLADAMTRTGLDTWFATLGTHLHGVPPILAIFAICLACQLLSEVMSNTALTALALPIVAAVAEKSGLPVVPILAAAALGASFAFVLPAGTPPNALVFASRQVRIGQMVRAGVVLDVLFAVFVTGAIWLAMRAGWGS